ncbi:MAG: PAS domain-containing protein, partial [Actinomycetota bacterium]|nr:PAS domain-containing protein [Actinomycetota bacterium]
MTLVNTVATVLAGQPGVVGLHAAIDALEAAGAPAALSDQGVSYGSARAGETIPLVAAGNAVAALRLEAADANVADAIGAIFAVSLAGRVDSAKAGAKTLTERLLEPLVDAVPTAVTVCEPGSWRILSANAAMRALVGYDDHEILGAEPPYPWWGEPPVRPVGEWTPIDRWEQLYRRADGSVVPVEGTTFTLHDGNGEPE